MTGSESGRDLRPPGRGPLGTRAPLIGLIGPIGCGKSTVAGNLADRGCAVIDADQLARDVMATGTPVTESILARFGEQYRRPDGSIDRAALGRLVFSDPDRLAELEAIVLARPKIVAALEGRAPLKVIHAGGRLVNIVVR